MTNPIPAILSAVATALILAASGGCSEEPSIMVQETVVDWMCPDSTFSCLTAESLESVWISAGRNRFCIMPTDGNLDVCWDIVDGKLPLAVQQRLEEQQYE